MRHYYIQNTLIRQAVKITLLFLIIPVWLQAQVFPVNVTPQVIPPYSLKLSEYSTSVTDKLILNLLLTDITESNRQVSLKFYVENNAGLSVQSNDVIIGANPIFLNGGVPLRLTNIDLQPYFQLQNLRGITPQQYSIPFPEGLYRFCFEVYDTQSGQQISRKSCATVYLVLNDPPFLNIPNRGEQVLMRDPQNIIFQWTPRHLNATNVEYEFTLAELWDNQMDPQAAFLASRPLYQTNTFATTLLYGPGETPLLPDKTYGWRVRAMVNDGISETSVFKNNGYSEIYYFTYTGSCGEPEYVLAEGKSTTTEKILWQGVDHLRYNVQYRKKDVENAVWFDSGTINEYTTIYNLEPGTTYEFRVGGQCLDNGPLTYSQIYEFTTSIASDETSTYNCGITPEIVITNQDPLETLVINDVFTAGDFPVTVKEVEGANGSFSGWGYIVVPYLQDTRLKVSFDGIRINSDYQLMDGVVVTDYDENWGGVNDISDEIDAITDFSSTLELLDNIIDNIDELLSSGQYRDYYEQLHENLEGNLPEELDQNLTQANENLNTAHAALEEAQNSGDEDAIKEAEENLASVKEDHEATLAEVKEFVKEALEIIKKALKEIENENSDNKIEEYQEQLTTSYAIVNTFNAGASSNETSEDTELEIEMIGGEKEISSMTGLSEDFKTQIKTYFNTEIDYNQAVVSRFFSKEYSTEKEREKLAQELKVSGGKLGTMINKMRNEDKPQREIIDVVKEVLYTEIAKIVINKAYADEDQ